MIVELTLPRGSHASCWGVQKEGEKMKKGKLKDCECLKNQDGFASHWYEEHHPMKILWVKVCEVRKTVTLRKDWTREMTTWDWRVLCSTKQISTKMKPRKHNRKKKIFPSRAWTSFSRGELHASSLDTDNWHDASFLPSWPMYQNLLPSSFLLSPCTSRVSLRALSLLSFFFSFKKKALRNSRIRSKELEKVWNHEQDITVRAPWKGFSKDASDQAEEERRARNRRSRKEKAVKKQLISDKQARGRRQERTKGRPLGESIRRKKFQSL